tara:strand:+ start:4212 stop:5375 length:1164 start_codon:yes stop_codon:yes gene_type:complete
MKKKINVLITSFSRSEFGLLYSIIKKINNDDFFKLNLLISGSHFEKNKGNTVDEVKNFGFDNYIKVKMNLTKDNKDYLSESVGDLTIKLTKKIKKVNPFLIICMGDRYELLALGTVSTILNIPLAHISGGEITEGAIDDQIRHAITKLSHIHFVANKNYKKNLIQMGEENWRICISGEPGLENLKLINKLNKKDILKKLRIKNLKNIIIITFHPVTLDAKNLDYQIKNLIKFIEKIENKNFIITGSNADHGGNFINKKFTSLSKNNKYVNFYYSLGSELYLNLLKYTELIIGNSSSGIVEAPSYGVKVINIGDRQKGRMQSKNVFNCGYSYLSILKAYNNANKLKIKDFKNPYYQKNSTNIIVNHLKKIFLNKNLKEILTKKFNVKK